MARTLDELTAAVYAKCAAEVQAGPFAGMTLLQDSSWYGGDVLAKLVGTYEMELWPTIEAIIEWSPDVVINVGCAEGYYATGFALALPEATIHAIDITKDALRICERAAQANRAEARMRLELSCTPASLTTLLRHSNRACLFVDCEACELPLIGGLDPQDLGNACFVIECHDFIQPGTTDALLKHLSATHDTRRIDECDRDPLAIPLLRDVPDDLRSQAISERRPTRMWWLAGFPKPAR
jgi:hypothetical protein